MQVDIQQIPYSVLTENALLIVTIPKNEWPDSDSFLDVAKRISNNVRKNIFVLVVPEGMSISSWSEKEMNNAGWYKKKE